MVNNNSRDNKPQFQQMHGDLDVFRSSKFPRSVDVVTRNVSAVGRHKKQLKSIALCVFHDVRTHFESRKSN